MVSVPELKKYVNKRVVLRLNGSRKIAGVLRGYDLFMNIVLDDPVELIREKDGKEGQANELASGTVIRGNSIIAVEALDAIN